MSNCIKCRKPFKTEETRKGLFLDDGTWYILQYDKDTEGPYHALCAASEAKKRNNR